MSAQLRAELGLGAPFTEDPWAADWGVANAVFALGDRFLEVVSPIRDGTAAGRRLERLGGDGGYMVMFQVPDAPAARRRARAHGARIVWELDLPDMAGTQLDPRDMPGAIVSLDAADPPDSWRWAGPAWTGRRGTGAPGVILGAGVAVPDPAAVAARWEQVLGVESVPDVRFLTGVAGLCEIEVALPEAVRDGRDAVEIAGVRFVLRPA